jgi:CubicO group peptidase (beta-lactamase class C family)
MLSYHAVSGGYIIAEIVQRVTGRDIRTVLEQEILDPLQRVEHASAKSRYMVLHLESLEGRRRAGRNGADGGGEYRGTPGRRRLTAIETGYATGDDGTRRRAAPRCGHDAEHDDYERRGERQLSGWPPEPADAPLPPHTRDQLGHGTMLGHLNPPCSTRKRAATRCTARCTLPASN